MPDNYVYIYVLNDDGTPLMPTKRKKHVRDLLNKGLARIKEHIPYTVQLKYHSEGYTQPLYGGTDPGRTNIGEAVLKGDGTVVYKAHLLSRNREIPKLMAERRQHRQASRRGERLARKRLAKRLGTTMKHLLRRKLPGYKDGMVTVKDIINTEARFNNRTRPDGWLTPTARQLVQTHINMVRNIRRILPVTYWSIETNRFAFMKMDDGKCCGADFQSGRMKDYPSVEAYVSARQQGSCCCCGKPIEHYHHIVPRHKGGSNLPENIAGLCADCHEKVHTGKITLDVTGIKKKYGALSVLNQAVPYIWKELVSMFGEANVGACFGYQTKDFREKHGLGKGHDTDAVAIAALAAGLAVRFGMPDTFELIQFRRHDRQNIKSQRERTYKYGTDTVAKNRRARFEQPEQTPALMDWYKAERQTFGKKAAQTTRSRLSVKPSARYYNNTGRAMPGAVFVYRGTRYVLTGQLSGGRYYRAYRCGKQNFPARECQVFRQNTGLVYA